MRLSSYGVCILHCRASGSPHKVRRRGIPDESPEMERLRRTRKLKCTSRRRSKLSRMRVTRKRRLTKSLCRGICCEMRSVLTDGLRQCAFDFRQLIAKARASQCREVNHSVPTLVQVGMNCEFRLRTFGIKLHRIGFYRSEERRVGKECRSRW